MLALFRRAGFDMESKVSIGAVITVCSGPGAQKWPARRALGQLQDGDKFRKLVT
jgi:hypothetical protein